LVGNRVELKSYNALRYCARRHVLNGGRPEDEPISPSCAIFSSTPFSLKSLLVSWILGTSPLENLLTHSDLPVANEFDLAWLDTDPHIPGMSPFMSDFHQDQNHVSGSEDGLISMDIDGFADFTNTLPNPEPSVRPDVTTFAQFHTEGAFTSQATSYMYFLKLSLVTIRNDGMVMECSDIANMQELISPGAVALSENSLATPAKKPR
jgi:hypothetical protein